MDHSEEDKRFYVYIHEDQNGVVRYIGSGTGYRFLGKSGRSKEHAELFDSLIKRKIFESLTKKEASEIEVSLINKHWDSGKLLNKRMYSTLAKPILYSEISEYLEYDESSPSCLRWKDTQKGNRKPFEIAGYQTKKGYWVCCLNYQTYKVHRLVWVLFNKNDLKSNMVIDHIDRDKGNNKINNLRLVTHRENILNTSSVDDAKNISVWWNSSRCFYVIRVMTNDERGFVEKHLSPHVLFPKESFEVGKERTFEIVNFMVNLICIKKNESDSRYLESSWVRDEVFSLVKRNRPYDYSVKIIK